jgi:hypothetical protein
MPYVNKATQLEYSAIVSALKDYPATSEGSLNYIITEAILAYYSRTKQKYADMNGVIGALDCAKEEFRRRIVNPYEIQKAFEANMNGADPYEVSGVAV